MKDQPLNLFLSLFYINYAISKKENKTKQYKQLLHVGKPSLLLNQSVRHWTHTCRTPPPTPPKKSYKKKIYTRMILHKDANTTLH